MLTAALFIIAKMWNQPKCPSIDEMIKKMSHTHTHTHTQIMEYFSAIKKRRNLATCGTQMDLEGIMLSEISQTKINTT